MKRKHYIILFLVILGLIAGFWGYREYTRTRVSTAEREPAFQVNATELVREFLNNETTATQKYNAPELIISVEGDVKEVLRDETGTVTLMLGDTASLSSVQCTMERDASDAMGKLHPGDQVSIRGMFNGYSADETGLLGSDVKLNHCILENK
jgi:hypothetical protein